VHRANEDPLRSYLIRDLQDASRFASAKLMARRIFVHDATFAAPEPVIHRLGSG